jgi:hypothetical protein
MVNMAPSQTMMWLYSETCEQILAQPDLIELEMIETYGESARFQFSCECSQNSYLHMLYTQDPLIGDYTKTASVTPQQRTTMVEQIVELHKLKQYKLETLFIAVGLADRFLSLVTQTNQQVPDMTHLALVCVLLAAKLEQPVSPSFNKMIALIPDNKMIKKKTLIDLEHRLVFALQFSLQVCGPITFAERFVTVFGLPEA